MGFRSISSYPRSERVAQVNWHPSAAGVGDWISIMNVTGEDNDLLELCKNEFTNEQTAAVARWDSVTDWLEGNPAGDNVLTKAANYRDEEERVALYYVLKSAQNSRYDLAKKLSRYTDNGNLLKTIKEYLDQSPDASDDLFEFLTKLPKQVLGQLFEISNYIEDNIIETLKQYSEHISEALFKFLQGFVGDNYNIKAAYITEKIKQYLIQFPNDLLIVLVNITKIDKKSFLFLNDLAEKLSRYTDNDILSKTIGQYLEGKPEASYDLFEFLTKLPKPVLDQLFEVSIYFQGIIESKPCYILNLCKEGLYDSAEALITGLQGNPAGDNVLTKAANYRDEEEWVALYYVLKSAQNSRYDLAEKLSRYTDNDILSKTIDQYLEGKPEASYDLFEFLTKLPKPVLDQLFEVENLLKTIKEYLDQSPDASGDLFEFLTKLRKPVLDQLFEVSNYFQGIIESKPCYILNLCKEGLYDSAEALITGLQGNPAGDNVLTKAANYRDEEERVALYYVLKSAQNSRYDLAEKLSLYTDNDILSKTIGQYLEGKPEASYDLFEFLTKLPKPVLGQLFEISNYIEDNIIETFKQYSEHVALYYVLKSAQNSRYDLAEKLSRYTDNAILSKTIGQYLEGKPEASYDFFHFLKKLPVDVLNGALQNRHLQNMIKKQ